MKETLRVLFQQQFNRDEYRRVVLQNLLHAQQLLREPQFLEETNDGDRIYGLGYLHDADGKEIGLYYTDVVNGDVRRKRVGFRQMMKSYVKYGADAAIAVFADKEYWRLSYMCDLKGGETSAKRFSYVFGDQKGQYNTPANRLANLGGKKIVLDDLKETFSVEALSKEFFKEYHEHYDCICDNIISHSHLDVLTPLRIHDYVKKMMGRIVFLHFLQKKRWLDDDPEFLKNLFFMQPLDRRADFLEQVLEPLFFGIFNTEDDQREKRFADEHWDKGLLKQWEKLPYLNGGLFERDEIDKLKIKLPASLFENLFSFMSSYNFTVDENDPDDAEVGVDPEMLGKIFESLLEDNKAKGAFYTPKEIVRYMCKESLIAYLMTKTGVEKDENIRRFVETHEFPVELNSQREIIDQALREVKICDPAIGSGAFPMGLLNELWRCREALEETASRVELKKEIIENNIYGVDIEKGAIDIARLRFWLSIVVDAENPEPLPNFDYKFMQGNSLIESFDGHDLSHILDATPSKPKLKGGQRGMFGDNANQTAMDFSSEDTRSNLRIWLSRYFSLTDHNEKARYRQHINNSVKSYIRQQGIGTTAEADLNTLDPSANQEFFLWHTWFKDIFDKGGFDIVIGNPPYVRQERLGMDYKKRLISTYQNVGNGTADLYVYFFGLGIKILNTDSVLAFITLNKYLKTKYGKELRDTLAKQVTVDRIIDFFELPVFNASTDAAITMFYKSQKNIPTRYFPIKTLENLDLTAITNGEYLSTIKDESEWQFVDSAQSSILEKICKDSITLKDFSGDKIYYGIKTGFNKAFIIKDSKVAQKLLTSESAPIIKKYAQSTDIKKWEITNDSKYFLATGFDDNIERKYPTAYNYLCQFKKELVERCDKGIHFYNLRACAYYDAFDKPKIIYIHTAKDHQFFFDTEGHYINNSCYMIVSNSKFLFCFLNSKLFSYFKKIKFVAYGDGQEAGRCKLDYNKMITVPIRKNVDEAPFEVIVDKINSILKHNSSADISEFEQEIDRMIYALYNITPEEIAIIEQN